MHRSHRLRPPRRVTGVAPAAVATALALLLPAAAPAATLDEAQRVRAEALARAVPWGEPRRTARGPATDHVLGVQTLAVEEAPRKGAPPDERRARVYQHDHVSHRTRRVVVDLVAGRALETRALASPHLPLNEDERRWSLARLAADAALLERLREEQRRRGRLPFASLDELDVKASVFEPTDPAHPCARERCALLSLFDATRTVFATEPVVRFADGVVETLDAGR